jgi:glycosyltransferase involved in cell wall biosynthesis
MKFCVLSSLTARSGSSIRNRGICRALAELGHGVTYLEPLAPGEEAAPSAGFSHEPVLVGSARPLFWMLPAALANLARLRALKPDAVLVMKPFPHTALPALLARRSCGAKVVVDFDDLDSGYAAGPLVRWLLAQMQLFFLRRADLICVHNAALREYLEAEGLAREKISFLGQGIGLENYAPRPGAGPALPPGWDGATVLVYAAHLGPAAALEPLFEIVAGLTGNFRLLVIGGGAQLEDFKTLARRLGAEGRTHFTGYLSHPETIAWLRRGHIALNYLYEEQTRDRFRSQIKIREYLALGLPVVSSRGGDIELFREFVEIAGDKADFSGRIMKLAADLPSAAARAARGRAWVTEKYSWLGLAREWLAGAGLDKL